MFRGYNQNWQYVHSGQNWRFAHSGGTLLMMTQAGEPWGYYPQDSNGLAVQSEVPAACVCVVYWQSLCAPIMVIVQ